MPELRGDHGMVHPGLFTRVSATGTHLLCTRGERADRLSLRDRSLPLGLSKIPLHPCAAGGVASRWRGWQHSPKLHIACGILILELVHELSPVRDPRLMVSGDDGLDVRKHIGRILLWLPHPKP